MQLSQHPSSQSSPNSGRRLLSGLAGLSVTAGLMAAVVPVAIAIPSPLPIVEDYKPTKKDYSTCTSKLLAVKLSVEDVTSACARALVPSDLGKCVEDVTGKAGIAATDALAACRQVRRPKEMANCVTDINRDIKDAAGSEVLGNCRASLFPDRFADCVIGSSREAKHPPTQAMNTCIDSTYFPREVDPTFISYPLVQPPESTVTPIEPITPTPTPSPAQPAQPSEVVPQKY